MQTLGTIIAANSSLRALDLSGNAISEEAGRLLRESMAENTTLQSMDLRLNQISVDTVAAVDDLCKKNKLEAQRTRRELFEAHRQAEMNSS